MATITPINIGAAPNDGTGDTLRTAFSKTNTNLTAINEEVTNNLTIYQEALSVDTQNDIVSLLSNGVARASATPQGFRIDALGSTDPLVNGILYQDNGIVKRSSGSHVSFITNISANHTLARVNKGFFLRFTNSNPNSITVTVPLNSSVAFREGDIIQWQHVGSGEVAFKGANGVTINGFTEAGGDETLNYSPARYSSGYLQFQGNNTWLLTNVKYKTQYVSNYTLYTNRNSDVTSPLYTLFAPSIWIFETVGNYGGALTRLQYRLVGDSTWLDVVGSDLYSENTITLSIPRNSEVRYIQQGSTGTTSITSRLIRISEI